MKGLRKYIAKHGKHLTEQLAVDALECRWNIPEVVKATESKVYYNVSEATLGDIVLMVNHFNSCFIDANKYDCVKWALKLEMLIPMAMLLRSLLRATMTLI